MNGAKGLKEILESFTTVVPEQELKARVLRLQVLMEKAGISIALLCHPPDLYYFGGTTQEGLLLIPVGGDPSFLIQKYPARAEIESPWQVIPLKSLKELPQHISLKGKTATEMDIIPYMRFQRLSKLFNHEDWQDISPLVRECKAIKSPWEVNILRGSGKLVVQGYLKAKEFLQEGISEIELATRVFAEMRLSGHENGETMRSGRMESFMGHILSGYSAAIPSYMNAPLNGIGLSPSTPIGPSRKRIARGEMVIMDFFGTHMGYITDMTRTLCLAPASTKMKDAHKVLMEMNAYLKNNLRDGESSLKIYEDVQKMAQNSPYRDHFMGHGDYKVNFIGHGVGTEIDEYPFIAKGLEMELKENMVVAVEPKFLFPGEGAVGLENTYLITPAEAESLTPAPEELWEKGA